MARTVLSTRDCEGHVVVSLRGDLDVLNADMVGAAIAAVVHRAPEIVIDLAGLEFIDCYGLRSLLLARKLALRAGGNLLLASARPQVLRVLALTGLVNVFSVHASVDEAAAVYRSGFSFPLYEPAVVPPNACRESGRPVS
jgi:anti-sigma B factor antagonist